MSASQIFVIIFAVISAAVSAAAIWRVATASDVRYRLLWIVGSLFGFAGFATTINDRGDLYLEVGIQIPVLLMTAAGDGGVFLKALFPVVAAAALVKFQPPCRPRNR